LLESPLTRHAKNACRPLPQGERRKTPLKGAEF